MSLCVLDGKDAGFYTICIQDICLEQAKRNNNIFFVGKKMLPKGSISKK